MARKTAKRPGRKTNAAFAKPLTSNSAQSDGIGSKPIPRTDVTKKVWAYIKKNKLAEQRARMIRSNAALRTVFGGKSSASGAHDVDPGLAALADLYSKL